MLDRVHPHFKCMSILPGVVAGTMEFVSSLIETNPKWICGFVRVGMIVLCSEMTVQGPPSGP